MLTERSQCLDTVGRLKDHMAATFQESDERFPDAVIVFNNQNRCLSARRFTSNRRRLERFS